MKITGTPPKAALSTALISQKTVTTLLELIKPLSSSKALVLAKGLGDIILEIKEPLMKGQLYQATVLQKDKSFILKEAFTLPLDIKKILLQKPLMPIEQFLSRLQQGSSPKKLALEAMNLLLSATTDPQEVKEILSQILHLAHTQEPIIPLSYDEHQGYIKFKKISKKNALYQIPFEAYFVNLGVITGYVSYFKNSKKAHLKVLSQNTKNILEQYQKLLSMELTVSIDKELKLSAENSLLDIQV